jgi:cell division protein FtsQ
MKINKPLIKKISLAILWSLLVVGFFTLWVFAFDYRKQLTCKKIDVTIDEAENKFFIDKKDVFNIIKQNGYDTLFQKKVSEINWIQLERKIKSNPWIDDAQLFSNRNGELEIDVKQRCPLMRIINKNGVGFYVDEKGEPMMLSSKFTAREIIVTGKIDVTDFNYTNPDKGKRFDIVKLIKFIDANPFWKAQIIQINIKENDQLQLFPLHGNHVIEFGTTENFEEKLYKLKAFYTEGLNKIGWSKYSVINVRYKNQIVAIRKTENKKLTASK